MLAEAAEGASSSSPCLGKGDGCCTSWCWEHRGDVGGLLVTLSASFKVWACWGLPKNAAFRGGRSGQVLSIK